MSACSFSADCPCLEIGMTFDRAHPSKEYTFMTLTGAPLHSQRTCSSYNRFLFFIGLNRASFHSLELE
jgi:hypothetical protein